MNRVLFLLIGLAAFLSKCNPISTNRIDSSIDSIDQDSPSVIMRPLTVSEFKMQLKESYPNLDSAFFQFHVDTFALEQKIDSLQDAGLMRKTSFSYSEALNEYLKIMITMQERIYQHIEKENDSIFRAEERAWYQYYLNSQEVISKVDDDENLGLGADYPRLIPKDMLQLVKQRTEVLFLWYWRVVEKDQR